MKRLLNIPFIQSYFKDAGVLTIGNVIGMLITLAGYPIITILYTDVEFGEFSVYQSIFIILISISSLHYNKAIVLTKGRKELNQLIRLILALTLTFCALLCILNLFDLPQHFDLKLSSSLYWAIIIGVFLGAYHQIAHWFFIKKGQFKLIAILKVTERFSFQATAIAYSFLQWRFLNPLVLAGISSQAPIFFISLAKTRFAWKSLFQLKAKAIAEKYKYFPMYSLPSGLVERISSQVPIFIISILASQAATGQFSLAYKILSVPEAVIGVSIANIFYKKVGELTSKNQPIIQEIKNCWKLLALIGLPVFTFCLLLGPFIFNILFGNEWKTAGEITSIISPMLFFMFMSTPTSGAMAALNKQYYGLIFGSLLLVTRISLLYFGISYYNLTTGIYLLTIGEILNILLYNYFLLKEAKKWERTHVQKSA